MFNISSSPLCCFHLFSFSFHSIRETLDLQLKKAPTARNVEELMGQHFVMSLASGTVNDTLKLYLYALEVCHFITMLIGD